MKKRDNVKNDSTFSVLIPDSTAMNKQTHWTGWQQKRMGRSRSLSIKTKSFLIKRATCEPQTQNFKTLGIRQLLENGDVFKFKSLLLLNYTQLNESEINFTQKIET
jgi:hypothetical protein